MKGGIRVLALCCLSSVCAGGAWCAHADAVWRSGGVPVCVAPHDQGYPFILADGGGGTFIAWRDDRDSATTGYDVYVQHLDGSGVAQWQEGGVPVCTATL